MTYREKLEELYNEFGLKSNAFLSTDKKVTEFNGFNDIKNIPEYLKSKSEFQEAANNYHSFASYLMKQNIDLETEYPVQ